MDKERILQMNGIVERLVNLDTERRTTALTLLYKLRTAAVEDLSKPSDSETQQNWDDVLESRDTPNDVRALVHDLIQLTDDELTMIVTYINEKTVSGKHQASSSANDPTDAPQLHPTGLAGTLSELDSYVEMTRNLASDHREKVAKRLKSVRDAIEQGVNDGQDVTQLEEIFDRLEREFWEQYLHHPTDTAVKTETE
ncbi:hypothetical protein G6514_009847 [Epicoccum nigrum]|nr:hypothetical protein G6514_009847 [Epicoccum nigrum]